MNDSEQIKAIRQRYQLSLPEKAQMVDEQYRLLSDSIEQPENGLNDTHEMLHKLAGSSGMYGYSDISALCRQAMVSAESSDLNGLLAQLAQLKELLEQHG